MNNNKGLIATIVVLIAVIITLIAVVFLMQMPTIFSVNNIKTAQTETTTVEKVEETTTIKKIEKIPETTVPKPKVSTKVETFTGYNDHVNIRYPQIEGMDDVETQDKLNNKIKTNAISIVKLYPISTAMQYLDIDCEVKSFDDKYITIVYEGEVVGSSIKNPGSVKKSSAPSNNATIAPPANYADPYLDGFVDPLAAFNQNFGQQIGIQQVVPPPAVYVPETVAQSSKPQSTSGSPANSNDSNTADQGPIVNIITAPTAASKQSQQTVGNYSNNNPVTPANGNSAPVYGFSGTNIRNDASTIDQKIFYTNVIDLKTGLDMTLKDYVTDLAALAKWTRSSKVEFVNVEEKDRKAVREYVNKTVQSKYEEQFKNADFRNEGVATWPKVFSYKDKDGTVYFSVRLSSKLGNYAIVKYSNK